MHLRQHVWPGFASAAAVAMFYPSAQNALNIIIARQTETVQRDMLFKQSHRSSVMLRFHGRIPLHIVHRQPATHASSGVHNTNINGVALYRLAGM